VGRDAKVQVQPPARSGSDLQVARTSPDRESIGVAVKFTRIWDAGILCLRRSAPAAQSMVPPPATNNLRTSDAPLQTTMLSIRADNVNEPAPNTLLIQCRTSVAVSNAHGTAASIHGVVTQEVVSSSGKILIMAGSKVVGSGILDSESDRFKSEGQWSIFFDNIELRVRARLLDRPHGLLGMIGQVRSREFGISRSTGILPENRLIVVPANSQFTLEAVGEIELRDFVSNGSVN
jgi:hypothetical protein